ncbi:MAG: type III-B CRISPR-associated protein Cas10/Cmr2 [Candidatus Edwardsbacteria bacterium]|nr:type III-B CRISPR-associated protein Cas10/Cmr2 [Candidatus Edwardsbacteria bacterium]
MSGQGMPEAAHLKGLQKETFKRTVDAAMAEAWEHSKDDEKYRFLYLWRNLLPLIQQHENDPVAASLWPYAPADTRIPDHSIFEHLRIAAACAGSTYENKLMLNNCSLYLFSIVPVQSFIAQARKAQDLYWGSYILSYLCWKAIERVCEEYGPDAIIFPDINGQPLADHWLKQSQEIDVVKSNAGLIALPTIPNRFMALLPVKVDDKLDSLGKALEDAVKSAFRAIADTSIGLLPNAKAVCFLGQIDQFLQVYWAAVPWPNDVEGKKAWENLLDECKPYFDAAQYGEMRAILEFAAAKGEYPLNVGNMYGMMHSLAEKALAARKNCREFGQSQEIGRKCSLCGERNVMVYRKSEREKGMQTAEVIDKKLFNDGAAVIGSDDIKEIPFKHLQAGEGLCAVCFAKRTAEKYFKQTYGEETFQAEFPSTAEIAASNVRDEKTGRPYLELLKAEVNPDFDDELLFDKNPASVKSETDRKIINRFKEYAKGHDRLPTPYYALLILDGDKMGEWLAGIKGPDYQDIYHPEVWKNLPDEFKQQLEGKKRNMTPAIHAAISLALKNYAFEFVRQIIEERHHGKVVYAGGDDVLAMVSIEHLPDTMLELRGAFSGHIDENFNVDFSKDASGFVNRGGRMLMTMGPAASASMGVCIAHYKTPLKTVLDTARRMEKKAKNEGNRNAFAITAIRHSGQGSETVFKWHAAGQAGEGAIGRLKHLVREVSAAPGTDKPPFSDKFIYTIRREFDRLLGGGAPGRIAGLDQMVFNEIKRLAQRQCQLPARSKEEQDARGGRILALSEMLKNLYLDSKELKHFFGFMDIAAFLARGDMR